MAIRTLTISRSSTGFGFTVLEGQPVSIGRVVQGSSADFGGLRRGDVILSVNGSDVTNTLAKSVATAIRESGDSLVLVVSKNTKRTASSDNEAQFRPIAAAANTAAGSYEEFSRNSCDTVSTSSSDLLSEDDLLAATSYLNDSQGRLCERKSNCHDSLKEDDSSVLILLQTEHRFIECMRQGLQQFSVPLLNHRIISPAEHDVLFHKTQEIMSTSERIVAELQKFMDDRVIVKKIAKVYKTVINELCGNTESYCSNIRKSFLFLHELQTRRSFKEYVMVERCRLAELTVFLRRPIVHFKDIIVGLQRCSQFTSDEEEADMDEIIRELKDSCTRICDQMNRGDSNTKSAKNSAELSPLSTRNDDNDNCDNDDDVNDVVDNEITRLERRLVFPNGIEVFSLRVHRNRYVCHAGGLLHLNEINKTLLYVVLFNDMLLLTSENKAKGTLLVMDDPIYLSSINSRNFSCSRADEFELGLRARYSSIDDVWEAPCYIRFRAPSVQSARTWRRKLRKTLYHHDQVEKVSARKYSEDIV